MASFNLRKVFDPASLRRIAAETELLRVEHKADIVVVRGLSGTLVASAMNALFGTPFAVVRKSEELSHGSAVEMIDYVEYDVAPRRYGDWIIVDDLIASGRTVEAIQTGVSARNNTIQGQCNGIVLYHWKYEFGTKLLGDRKVPVFYIGPEETP